MSHADRAFAIYLAALAMAVAAMAADRIVVAGSASLAARSIGQVTATTARSGGSGVLLPRMAAAFDLKGER
jgi:hypothetical protein